MRREMSDAKDDTYFEEAYLRDEGSPHSKMADMPIAEVKLSEKQREAINKIDGLIHLDGKVFDPLTMNQMKAEDFMEKSDEDETTYEQAVKDIESDKKKK